MCSAYRKPSSTSCSARLTMQTSLAIYMPSIVVLNAINVQSKFKNMLNLRVNSLIFMFLTLLYCGLSMCFCTTSALK